MNIHILGASGSGVTTLGRALEQALNIPYADSDDYFWLPSDPPFTLRRDPNDRNGLIQSWISGHTHWILGGSVIDWGEAVFPAFDLVVFLGIPPEIRRTRLINREQERYGDALYSDPDRAGRFARFMAWAMDYDHPSGIAHRTLPAHETWLATLHAPVLRLTGDLTTEERLTAILATLHSQKLLPGNSNDPAIKSVF